MWQTSIASLLSTTSQWRHFARHGVINQAKSENGIDPLFSGTSDAAGNVTIR